MDIVFSIIFLIISGILCAFTFIVANEKEKEENNDDIQK